MNKIFCFSVLAFFLLQAAVSRADQKPPVKYFIAFKDKSGTPFSIDQPEKFLSHKSIVRRSMYGIKTDFTDLPVSPAYIAEVAAIQDAKVIYAIKWLNGVVVQLDSIDLAPVVLSKINSLPFVNNSRQVKKFSLDLGRADQSGSQARMYHAEQLNASSGANGYAYGGSRSQNHQLGVDCLHEQGYRGQGMTIAVLDAGFGSVDANPVFDSLRQRGGILGGRDFVSGGEITYNGGTHGSMVLSCMAANVPGLILGSAPMANYWLLRTEEPAENPGEEYNWIRGAEFADSVGADILTTSLGYTEFDDPSFNHTYATLNGRTAPMSIAATMAVRKGMFVLNSAGNEGASSFRFISVPADADSVCSVGAADSLGRPANFSSVGPTADGRIKPDFLATGVGTWVSQTNLTCFPGNGTSFAAPVLAGAVACYWQAHRSINNMGIMRQMKQAASNSEAPNNLYGWGLPNLCRTEFDFLALVDPQTRIVQISLLDGNYGKIKVTISDMSGKTLHAKELEPKEKDFFVDGFTLSDGIYVVTVKSSSGTRSRKIVK